MKLLLDTSILLWLVSSHRKLGRKTKRLLVRPDTQLWLSPISIWECLMLERSGCVQLEPNPVRWVRATLSAHSFREAPLNHEVALHTHVITVEHGDPADRFLAATAAVYDLTLVTADDNLLNGGGYAVLGNE